jgi:hypothetical protein
MERILARLTSLEKEGRLIYEKNYFISHHAGEGLLMTSARIKFSWQETSRSG